MWLITLVIASPLRIGMTPVFRIYSDASFEDGALRLGWVCFPPQAQAFGGTCSVPESVIHSWHDRKQQIFPGETLCGLIVPWFHHYHLRGHDIGLSITKQQPQR